VDDQFEYHLSSGTLRFIRFKARQLAGRYGFRRDEIDDIAQTLVLLIIERAAQFDGRRSSPRTFAGVVVNSGISSIVKSHKAQRRDYRLCRPLDWSPDSSGHFPVPRYFDPAIVECPLRTDVARALGRLDPADRRVAFALMDYSPMEASRELGLARSTVYRHIARLRTAFIAAGLGARPGRARSCR
jgi:DNA-directed RNA polymerase specialized sigma24 family protein